jgi:dihydropteroate synthase
VSGPAPLLIRLRERKVRVEPGRPLLMGVVNASPESFFDGGRHASLDAQEAHARAMAEAGATLIDVGGESGVTNLPPVTAAEEIRRVVPLVGRLAADGLLVSVDTWKAEVASAAIDAGAVLVNDASGLSDPELAAVCARTRAGLVLTHTRAAPKVKAFPVYEDVRADVVGFLRERMALARSSRVDAEQLLLDPGPDLAKTPAETVAVLRALEWLHALGRPVLLSASRKDFVGTICDRPPGERLAGTLAAIGEGVDAGAALIRAHDVAAVADFLAVREALRGDRAVPDGLRLEEPLRRESAA